MVTDREDVIAPARGPNSVSVDECMTRDVVTCRPEDDVETTARLMGENQIRRIAVTDEGHHLAGIVSLADISWNRELNAEETAGVAVYWVSSPRRPTRLLQPCAATAEWP